MKYIKNRDREKVTSAVKIIIARQRSGGIKSNRLKNRFFPKALFFLSFKRCV